MATKPLKIKITSDTKSFDKGLGNVRSGLGKLAGPAAAAGAAIAGAFAIKEIVGFGTELFGLSANLEDLSSKVSTVFPEMEGQLRTWADEWNEVLGMGQQELAGMAAGIGDLLKPMGFTEEAAFDLATGIIELSAALSLNSGGKISNAQASEALSKAYLGEYDGLVALGIKLDAATVEQRALEIATADGRTEVTKMDKALAVDAIVHEQSADAIRNHENAQGNLSQKVLFVKAKFADLKEYLATKLNPVFNDIMNFVVERLVPAFQDFTGWLQEMVDQHGPAVTDAFNTVRDALTEVVDWLRQMWEEHGGEVISFFEDAATATAELAGAISDDLNSALDWTIENWERLLPLVGAAATIFGALLVRNLVLSTIAMFAKAAAVWANVAAWVALYWPIAAVIAVLALLVAAVIYAYQNWDWFREAVDAVAAFMVDTLWPALQSIWAYISENLIPIVETIIGYWWDFQTTLAEVVIEIGKFVVKAVEKFAEFYTTVKDKIGDIKDAVLGLPQSLLDKVGDFLSAGRSLGTKVIDGIKEGISGAASIASGLAQAVKNKVRGVINSGIIDRVNRAVEFTIDLPFGGSFTVNPPNIPHIARGTGNFPGGLAMVGEFGRELVNLPPGAQVASARETKRITSGGGEGVVVNVHTNADPYAIGREVAWAMKTGGR